MLFFLLANFNCSDNNSFSRTKTIILFAFTTVDIRDPLEYNDAERHAFFKANCVYDFKNLNACQELLNRISNVPDRST